VRPVNLLPGEHRPRRASGALSGSSYVVVGGLAALLLLAGLYVFTANKVTSRENQTAVALQQTRAAQAKIDALGAYGDFATVAQQRSASVKRLAAGRFDWERLTRELAVVLPQNVWLTEVDASVTSEETATGTAANAATPQASGPSAKLVGCAKKQPDVAKLMVRLKQLHRVDDVQLKESAKGDSAGLGGSSTSGTSSSAGSTASGDDCGSAYGFELTVVFDEQSPTGSTAPGGESPRVPARLGGGQ
jgi:Tfp pilus assembly protein PilN